MRILHVVPTYLPAVRYGGPIRSVHGLCKALASRGHDVEVFTTSVDGDGDSEVPLDEPVNVDGVEVRYFRSAWGRRVYWSPGMRRALRARVREFDVAHLHSIFLWPTTAAASAARHAGVPYVVSPRGMLVRELIARKSRWPKSAWVTVFERRNLEAAAAIHVTSDVERRDCEQFEFSWPPMLVVPNGIEPVALDPPAQPASIGSRSVLYLGRVNWKKGIDRLLKAISLMPGTNLVIAGNDEEGYARELEAIARELGIWERIRLVGQVGDEDKAALFDAADVMVLPSYSENFGNVVLEAAAHGCPVVLTPEVGLADVVAEHGAGVVSDGAPEALATSINRLLTDAQARAILGENARRMVAEQFAWDRVAERMTQAYEAIVSGRPASELAALADSRAPSA